MLNTAQRMQKEQIVWTSVPTKLKKNTLCQNHDIQWKLVSVYKNNRKGRVYKTAGNWHWWPNPSWSPPRTLQSPHRYSLCASCLACVLSTDKSEPPFNSKVAQVHKRKCPFTRNSCVSQNKITLHKNEHTASASPLINKSTMLKHWC